MIIWGRALNVELEQALDDLRVEAMLKGKGEYIQKKAPAPNDIFVTCPNYEAHGGVPEKTPSCSIRREDGVVHCFGCGFHTSFPGLVAHILGLKSAVEGFAWIRRKYSAPKPGQRKSILTGEQKRLEKKLYITEDALEQYNWDHPYMFERHLTGEVVDWFDVGYDQETDSLTFPMRDVDNRIVFIKKRPIKKKGPGKYIIEEGADKREIVYGLFMVKRYIERVKMLYISEGEMDTLSWYCAEKYGAGLQGSELFDEQVRQLVRLYRGRPICLALDNDKAGYKCFHQCVDKLSPYFPLYRLVYPRDQYFKDPNALLAAGRLKNPIIEPVGMRR